MATFGARAVSLRVSALPRLVSNHKTNRAGWLAPASSSVRQSVAVVLVF
jgi:hypothetical protein